MSTLLVSPPRNMPGITTIMADVPAIATTRAMSRPSMNILCPATMTPTTAPPAAT
ncbi:MAG: hypothetical protein IAF94_20930 [Pirellulaceae bacterium]|nr:hypothetical protein [Pirellulaceae bacterium]